MEAAANSCKNLKTVNLSYTSSPPASIALLTAQCFDLEVLKLAGLRNIVSLQRPFERSPYLLLDGPHICHYLAPWHRCQWGTHTVGGSTILKAETYADIGDQRLPCHVALSCSVTSRCILYTYPKAYATF